MARTVDILTSMWDDPWFLSRPPHSKLLFFNVISNQHSNNACIYEISYETLAHETKIPIEEIDKWLEYLKPKVKYDKENQIVFAVNYVRHQYMKSGKISNAMAYGVVKSLRQLGKIDHPFIKIFCEKYPMITSLKELKEPGVSEFKSTKNEQKLEEEYRSGKPRDYKDNAHFMEFWNLYPKHDIGPKGTYKSWPYPMPDDLFETIMKALREQMKSQFWQQGRIPYASTWLNQERWLGEVREDDKPAKNALPAPKGKYDGVGEKVNTDG